MAKKWSDVRSGAIRSEMLDEAQIAEHKERLLSKVRAHRLGEIRSAYGLNQTDVAKRLKISQPRVSRIERGDLDTSQVATLRAYVNALGGELEILAKFGEDRVKLE